MANNWYDQDRRNNMMDDNRNNERRGGLASSQSDRPYDDVNRDVNREWRSYDRNEDRNSMRSGADYGSYGRDWGGSTSRDMSRDTSREPNRDWSSSIGRSLGFGEDNRVGSRSYDWGSPTYGSRDINDRNFGREWDKGSSLMPNYHDYSRGDFRGGSGSYGFTSNEDFAARSAGLESRRNYIGRGPKGYRRSDDRIKEDVSDILERHPDIDASEIEVDVKEGMVTLRGSVDHRRTKRMVEDSIEHINGVKDVRNELSVNQSLFEQAKEFFTGESSTSKEAKKPTSARH